MSNYATIDDVTSLWRKMTVDEQARAEKLLSIISSSLRVAAAHSGKSLDVMIAQSADLKNVATSVVVDVVARTLMTSTDQEPMLQASENAGGYSASGTFLVPGGGLFIKKAELARLGLCKQKYGVMNVYGTD